MAQKLVFATQGGQFSYHAEAARIVSRDPDVRVLPCDDFSEVVRASRQYYPGLGVIAISTRAGTVDESAAQIVRKRPSTLPPIVARVDVPVELALIGSVPQSLGELNRRGVRCLGQKPAIAQGAEYLKGALPWLRVLYRSESTAAIQEMLDAKSPNVVAVGPAHAAQKMGGFIIGDSQINPPDSVTSFYVLQRDPRQSLLSKPDEYTTPRTVISLAVPEGPDEFAKCAEIADRLGLRVGRFIRFDIGDFTKYHDGRRRGGGILEIAHDRYEPVVPEFCSRVNEIESNGHRGPFTTKVLGDYTWLPEEPIDLSAIQFSPQVEA